MRHACRGFSLVELIIVIAIFGIAASIATLNFNQMTRKAQIEKQTKELFSDINNARLQSVYMKKRHRIVFQPNSYVFKEYSSLNEIDSAATKVLFSKNVSNQMTTKSGDSINPIDFDIRGYTYNYNTIMFNPINSGAAFDCIVISDARTNMGQMGSGNVCNQK